MTQRLITHLRHVDLAVPDFGKQLDFYTNTWGLTAEHSDSGLAFLAAEGSPEQIRHDAAVVSSYLGTDERAIERSDATRPTRPPAGLTTGGTDG